ncbi:Smr/MutS family protein [Flavobacterium sp. JP2137]|uniref:Smr/MutS family protein n=1 Tax=Flavobacterium sp. JP2137 TaxID=3414510 RepID=UPI003D2FBCAB
MISKGDQVAVLDEDQNGIVVAVNQTEVTIETEDGFLLKYQMRELLKIGDTSELKQAATLSSISAALLEKQSSAKRSFVKEKKSKKEEFVMEVDLHIEKLVPSFRGMSNHDILTLQVDTAKGQVEFAIRNKIPRIVFIHGVGEGILKLELDYMFARYPEVIFEDANYQKYGLGATQVYIKQNPNR